MYINQFITIYILFLSTFEHVFYLDTWQIINAYIIIITVFRQDVYAKLCITKSKSPVHTRSEMLFNAISMYNMHLNF